MICIAIYQCNLRISKSVFNYVYTGNDESDDDDELSTGVAVAISTVVTFIITLVVTALITLIIISLYYIRLINHIRKSTVVQKGTSDAHVLAEDVKMYDLANIAETNADRTNATLGTNFTELDCDSAFTLIS